MLPAHLLLGKALLKQGDLKGAEAAFEEALNQGIDRSEVVLPLGQIYIAIGRPEFVIDRIPVTGLPPALQVEVLSMRGRLTSNWARRDWLPKVSKRRARWTPTPLRR